MDLSALPDAVTSLLSTTTLLLSFFFFFNDTATTEIYTLSLHDALPISLRGRHIRGQPQGLDRRALLESLRLADRKSTRLNSSHLVISYAVFCLKKKNDISAPDSIISIIAILIHRLSVKISYLTHHI